MTNKKEDEAIAEFIRLKGATRCPTACASPTQAKLPSTDRDELQKHIAAREAEWLARHPRRKHVALWWT